MITGLFAQDHPAHASPREGELYKILQIHDRQFELRYGYYELCERENPVQEPMPIYPDFVTSPQYTSEGFPFVTMMQDICPYFSGERDCFSECAECGFYRHGDDLIGICACPANRQKTEAGTQESQL